MMRHLTKLALAGILGVALLSADAQACHRNRCGGGCGGVSTCGNRGKWCGGGVSTCGNRGKWCGGGGLFGGKWGGGCGCHKRNACTGPVVACNYGGYGYAAPMATGQYYGTPQATGQTYTAPQYYGTPQVPTKR